MCADRRHTGVFVAISLVILLPGAAPAQDAGTRRIADATEVLGAFMTDEATAIPAELLDRARGIAVIPQVFRGGFILGARRGRGILAIRTEDGTWSNPAFVTLTGGSIGWQLGAESTDLVLVFANDNAVKNIANGKFTLGGDASAVAGPLGRQRTMAVTFKAEVYSYVRSRGLYAGAAFAGARLDIDEATAAAFYPADTRPFDPVTESSPEAVRAFVRSLDQAAAPGPAPAPESGSEEGAQTFPLEDLGVGR